MTAWDIINALDALDTDLVLDVKQQDTIKRAPARKLFLVAAVVALTGLLVLSAVAATDGAGWFGDFFFSRSGETLTSGQTEFIQSNTVEVGKTLTRDGYTITFQSAITDGRRAFFRFLLIAPEGTRLDADWYGEYMSSSVVNEAGEDLVVHDNGFYAGYNHWTFIPVEGTENQITLLYEALTYYSGQRPISEHIWTFNINGLWKGYRDEEVGLRTEKIADGIWSFDIRFPEGCERELELIKEPVTVECVLGGLPGVPGITPIDHVQITSFDLRALTAEVTFCHEDKESVNGHFGDVYLVMEDGTMILMNYEYNIPNVRTFRFNAPIDLDQADHVLFPDGTVLPVA